MPITKVNVTVFGSCPSCDRGVGKTLAIEKEHLQVEQRAQETLITHLFQRCKQSIDKGCAQCRIEDHLYLGDTIAKP